MTNRDLLKEAIADAKAVKETAIANAKAALEEAFTPHLKSMLSAKLEEMDKDEDVELEEMDAVSWNEKNNPTRSSSVTLKDPKKVGQTTSNYAINLEEEEMDEEINLDELLAELDEEKEIEEVNESEEISETEEVAEAEEDEDVEDVEDMEAEGEMEDDEIDLEDMTEDDLKSFIEDVIKDMVEAGELEAGEEMEDEADMEDMGVEGDMEIEGEDEAEEIMENEEVEEGYGDRADAAAGGLENIVNGLQDLAKKGGEMGKKAMDALQKLGVAAGSAMRNEAELDEVEELKKELQEVNLLNAKLLYTNKIFKSKNLSEDKKVKVLKAFDKAETVKEAKVIFETLNEGIVSRNTNSMVNEVKGSASKAMGISQTTKQPIVENDAFLRMQKLAGIIK
jgi:hypothetical protein